MTKLMPAALAALVFAAAVPASAQFDASIAAEVTARIAAMRSAAQSAPKPAPAKAAPPAAAEGDWKKILDGLKAKGKYKAGQPPFTPDRFVLDDVKGDKNADHAEDGATALGLVNDDGLFEAMGFVFLSEDWKKGADGNWNVDRWMFQTDVYGTVTDVGHMTAVLAPDQSVVSSGSDKTLKAGDPRIDKKFTEITAHWAAPRP